MYSFHCSKFYLWIEHDQQYFYGCPALCGPLSYPRTLSQAVVKDLV